MYCQGYCGDNDCAKEFITERELTLHSVNNDNSQLAGRPNIFCPICYYIFDEDDAMHECWPGKNEELMSRSISQCGMQSIEEGEILSSQYDNDCLGPLEIVLTPHINQPDRSDTTTTRSYSDNINNNNNNHNYNPIIVNPAIESDSKTSLNNLRNSFTKKDKRKSEENLLSLTVKRQKSTQIPNNTNNNNSNNNNNNNDDADDIDDFDTTLVSGDCMNVLYSTTPVLRSNMSLCSTPLVAPTITHTETLFPTTTHTETLATDVKNSKNELVKTCSKLAQNELAKTNLNTLIDNDNLINIDKINNNDNIKEDDGSIKTKNFIKDENSGASKQFNQKQAKGIEKQTKFIAKQTNLNENQSSLNAIQTNLNENQLKLNEKQKINLNEMHKTRNTRNTILSTKSNSTQARNIVKSILNNDNNDNNNNNSNNNNNNNNNNNINDNNNNNNDDNHNNNNDNSNFNKLIAISQVKRKKPSKIKCDHVSSSPISYPMLKETQQSIAAKSVNTTTTTIPTITTTTIPTISTIRTTRTTIPTITRPTRTTIPTIARTTRTNNNDNTIIYDNKTKNGNKTNKKNNITNQLTAITTTNNNNNTNIDNNNININNNNNNNNNKPMPLMAIVENCNRENINPQTTNTTTTTTNNTNNNNSSNNNNNNNNRPDIDNVGIFWDIENIAIPPKLNVSGLITKIRREFIPNTKREVEFMCVCDVHKENRYVIDELNRCNITIVHVDCRSKNAADERLKHYLHRFAQTYNRPSTVILMSGDVNFAPVMSNLTHYHGLNTILIHNLQCSTTLKDSVERVVLYQEFIQGIVPRQNIVHNQPCFLIIDNLPFLMYSELYNRLERLCDNTGGKIVNLTPPNALVRFSNLELCIRAQKRLNNSYITHTQISAKFAPQTIQTFS